MASKKLSLEKEWAKGYGRIRHTPETIKYVRALKTQLDKRGVKGGASNFYETLMAADKIANAAMWLVAHDTYTRKVYLDGRQLSKEDFKIRPEGHTGGSLNIVIGYVGYLLANILTGFTRGWIMEQGHAVSGIDSVNLLVGNLTPEHASRYSLTDQGLSKFVQDFYAYKIADNGKPLSPRGSHVNAHTAGGIMEGGYLGFAGLQYVHMPLPRERLVAFLSDGAFEEQRGPDWAPRWWRSEDCGLVTPIMINNGRRIDQRTTMNQMGGTEWLEKHLKLNGFDPVLIDGRDPASYARAIIEMEFRLQAAAEKISAGIEKYPVRLPYGIATTIKGFGFYGQGTNLSHNVPLGQVVDDVLIQRFNASASLLYVPLKELKEAIKLFQFHNGRLKEKDNPFVNRNIKLKNNFKVDFKPVGARVSSMKAVDDMFVGICKANPGLRVRIGNPDEISSNRMDGALSAFKHRVTDPEAGINESVYGGVITALNEEAVACAALANKGGINLIITYEAFGVKMHGVLRQEIIFASHCIREGRPQNWLSIPVILTSHTYENGKNEQSHQDPMLCEALMGEPAHVSRVVFPADFNSAVCMMEQLYKTHGQIWTVVIPKAEVETAFDRSAARELIKNGAVKVKSAGYKESDAKVILTAIGAYQLKEVLKASRKLKGFKVPHSVIYMFEPRRWSRPKDEFENKIVVPESLLNDFYPRKTQLRLFVTHTRAGRIEGLFQETLNTGRNTLALGYRNEGGTLSTDGMLFINHQSWAHCLESTAKLLGVNRNKFLSREEILALDNLKSPHGVIF